MELAALIRHSPVYTPNNNYVAVTEHYSTACKWDNLISYISRMLYLDFVYACTVNFMLLAIFSYRCLNIHLR